MRKPSFLQAFKAEIKEWKRLTAEEETIIRMFCACIAIRLRGEDPAEVLHLVSPANLRGSNGVNP